MLRACSNVPYGSWPHSNSYLFGQPSGSAEKEFRTVRKMNLMKCACHVPSGVFSLCFTSSCKIDGLGI